MTKPTQEQVIAWAQIAGMERCDCEPRCHLHTGRMGSLTTLATLAYEAGRKDENEACAALCFQMWSKWMDSRVGNEILDNSNCPDAEDCAFAIRERGAP